MPKWEISRENSYTLRSLLLLDLRSLGLNGQSDLLRGGLLTREHDSNHSAGKATPDETLDVPEPLCFSAKNQRAKCPAKAKQNMRTPIIWLVLISIICYLLRI
jgi:hypothetical protein